MDRRPAEIYENVRAVMRQRGVAGTELAKRIGLTRSGMQRRLAGESQFTARDMLRIAAALNCDIRELYGLITGVPDENVKPTGVNC